jgi:hypothetical protein
MSYVVEGDMVSAVVVDEHGGAHVIRGECVLCDKQGDATWVTLAVSPEYAEQFPDVAWEPESDSGNVTVTVRPEHCTALPYQPNGG